MDVGEQAFHTIWGFVAVVQAVLDATHCTVVCLDSEAFALIQGCQRLTVILQPLVERPMWGFKLKNIQGSLAVDLSLSFAPSLSTVFHCIVPKLRRPPPRYRQLSLIDLLCLSASIMNTWS